MRARTSLVALLVALAAVLAAPCALAGPEDVANDTLESSGDLVDGVVGGLKDTADGIGDGVQDVGEGAGDAASSVGHALAEAAKAVGRAVAAAAGSAAKGLGTVGGAIAGGLVTGIAAAAAGSVAGLASLGQLGGALLAATAAGLAAGVVAAWGLLRDAALGYLDLVKPLRPGFMPEPVFAGLAATGAAASAGAAGWSLWEALRRLGLAPLALAGFSRIEDDELLQHPLRAHVFQVIQSNPGIHASALAREVNVGWGTIVHHLEKLEKASLVTTRKVNNQKCYFEVGGRVSRNDMAILSAVKGQSTGAIAQFVSSHPMTSQKEMAQALGISPALASFHVKKLTNLGVIDKVRRGKETLLTTTDSLRRVLSPPAAPMAAAAVPALA